MCGASSPSSHAGLRLHVLFSLAVQFALAALEAVACSALAARICCVYWRIASSAPGDSFSTHFAYRLAAFSIFASQCFMWDRSRVVATTGLILSQPATA